ncbi:MULTISPECIES: KAP family NTPase [Variovorax]|uniref:KAP family NTPase n=1 Tax=Variovorax TaxID=34072 RepID=UPI0021BDA083
MRLLLFIKRSAFVIAADNDFIKGAVRVHFAGTGIKEGHAGELAAGVPAAALPDRQAGLPALCWLAAVPGRRRQHGGQDRCDPGGGGSEECRCPDRRDRPRIRRPAHRPALDEDGEERRILT